MLLGVSSIELSESSDALLDDSACLTDGDCLGAFIPAQLAAYGQSGWTRTRIHTLIENTDSRPGASATEIIEAVIDFPSAAAAGGDGGTIRPSAAMGRCCGLALSPTASASGTVAGGLRNAPWPSAAPSSSMFKSAVPGAAPIRLVNSSRPLSPPSVLASELLLGADDHLLLIV